MSLNELLADVTNQGTFVECPMCGGQGSDYDENCDTCQGDGQYAADSKFGQFVAECRKTGYDVTGYHGRFFYHGPAVIVHRDKFQDVVRATTMPLQTDDMGKSDIVVYPK